MSTSRILYIDESLSKRIATILNQRGRLAESASATKRNGMKDEPLLRDLYESRDDIVFVTADDDLPREHPGVLGEVGATVATVAPYIPGRWQSHQPGLSAEEAYKREIVMRWAHAMQDQERGTSRRYFLSGGTKWTARRKRAR